jgi:hypothetical protein
MIRACQYCQRELTGLPGDSKPGQPLAEILALLGPVPVSHGICEECMAIHWPEEPAEEEKK